MATNKAPPPPTSKPPPAKARSRAERARALGERGFERAQKLPYAHVALHSFEREQRSGAGLLAGGLAYRFFFWLVAFGLLVAAVASFWVREDQSNLEDAAKSFGLSGVAAHSAASAVQDGSNARWYLLLSGFVLLVYFGVGAVRALRVTAFIAWEVKPTRMRQPLTASVLCSSVFVAALATELFASWVREQSRVLGLIATCAAVAVFLALAVFTFSLLPRPEGTNWLSLLPGAVLVAVGVAAIHFVTIYYLSAKLERSPQLYGALGAATVVLLGLYLIARVVVSAMFLNATLHRRRMA